VTRFRRFRWQPSGNTGGELEQAVLLTELLFKSTSAGLAGQGKCSLNQWRSADENKRLGSAIQTLKKIKVRKSFIRIFTLCNSYWLLSPLQQYLQNVHVTGLNVWKHTSEKIWKSGFLDWHRCNFTWAQVPNPEAVLDELGKKEKARFSAFVR